MSRHRAALGGLVGRRITAVWVVWILEEDEWFTDLPVVLVFDDGRQLELCWQRVDDLSISWETIDLAVPPVAWVTWALQWRAAADPAVNGMIGRVVTEVVPTGGRHEMAGLWFGAADTGLYVYAAGDENGFAADRRGDRRRADL
ncbi:hypothetical protein GIS00_20120 [Nakamurella sp. YIM 132087]|uniref:Uncharacterized protein n=1 Tax=Nakamurella alba TaxID=2665158 RepID=A0A7K1FS99_9ACTN|nr:hypothetical protein [Nakamurella alba]MTD16249.1 hypothetical protein [Nakamurella alba]